MFANNSVHSYAGSVNFPEIDFFLLDHAVAKNKTASKPTAKAKPKAKADKKEEKAKSKAAKKEEKPKKQEAKPAKAAGSKAKSKYSKDKNQRVDLATLDRSKLEKVQNAGCAPCMHADRSS